MPASHALGLTPTPPNTVSTLGTIPRQHLLFLLSILNRLPLVQDTGVPRRQSKLATCQVSACGGPICSDVLWFASILLDLLYYASIWFDLL
ncbi:hypothetical protein DEO72_LG7g2572 [Vigna unguiculata]|uniref:Uncharacterized protein n=1 Tax=Vigna unguiculata TaxID=3917 RepID=A0A4D6MIK6_VIGUN|nr:hypothetical protein DEO72_LG7g2572 [Vigna unguiculata]